jgi:hypothetical protein
MPDPSKPRSSAEKRKIDEKLDDALEESFPGSDPVSAAGALSPRRFRPASFQAEEKSMVLLRSWLSPEQLKRGREFEVIGCDTGNRYRISDTTSLNVLQLGPSGDAVAKWCFSPKGSLVMGRCSARAKGRIGNNGT